MISSKIRVVVVDDSSFVRKFVSQALSRHPDIEVVGEAANGLLGLEKIAEVSPDAVTCDVEMPEMDGLTAVVEIRKRWPDLPVIMLSTLTSQGAATSIEALMRGATDFAEKPSGTTGPAEAIRRLEEQLVPKLLTYVGQKRLANIAKRSAAPAPGPSAVPAPAAVATPPNAVPAPPVREPVKLKVEPAAKVESKGAERREFMDPVGRPAEPKRAEAPAPRTAVNPTMSGAFLRQESARAPEPAKPAVARGRAERPDLLLIGVSTGGPNALAELVPALPADLPVPVLIVQHMPPLFTKALAERLDQRSRLKVMEATDGAVASAGEVWIAPGDYHMTVEARGGKFVLRLNQAAAENGCRPAVDVLFRSAASAVGGRALVVMLTGMGQDGLKGSEPLVAAGAQLLAQDEASSVVWGMPGAVTRAGLASKVLPLSQMAGEITRLLRR